MLKKPLNRKKKFNKASYITVKIDKDENGSFLQELKEEKKEISIHDLQRPSVHSNSDLPGNEYLNINTYSLSKISLDTDISI